MSETEGSRIQDAIEAIQRDASKEEVDSALRTIEPEVTQIAQRVCTHRRVAGNLEHDLTGEALGLIWKGLKRFDADKAPFQAWAYRVLMNALKDMWRRKRKAPLSLKDESITLPPDRQPDHRGLVAKALDWTAPFSEDDLARIEAWKTRDRLRLLAVSRLWRKIPESAWEDWCRESNVEAPFPPTECVPEDNPEWMKLLAKAIGENFGAFKRHWHRKRKHLGLLDFVKGLR